jgi:hypothetical protein
VSSDAPKRVTNRANVRECTASVVGSVCLVLPCALLSVSSMVRRPHGPYQVSREG